MRTYTNIMTVFLLSGLWHGANWTFILWGVCHGFFSVITRRFKEQFGKLHPVLNWLITFLFINVTWVIFRADTIQDAVHLIKRIVLFDFGEVSTGLINSFNLPELVFLDKMVHILKFCSLFFLIGFTVIAFLLLFKSENSYEKMKSFKPTFFRMVVTAFLLAWCIVSFSGVSTFLYFNF